MKKTGTMRVELKHVTAKTRTTGQDAAIRTQSCADQTWKAKPMTDVDKIIAAIFTAALCARRGFDETEYLDTYDEFLDEIKLREKTRKKPMVISDKVLVHAKRGTRRS
jgi:hypothetical protein